MSATKTITSEPYRIGSVTDIVSRPESSEIKNLLLDWARRINQESVDDPGLKERTRYEELQRELNFIAFELALTYSVKIDENGQVVDTAAFSAIVEDYNNSSD